MQVFDTKLLKNKNCRAESQLILTLSDKQAPPGPDLLLDGVVVAPIE